VPSVRLGLIGTGRWGRAYARTIAGIPGVRLARLAGRTHESATLAGADCIFDTDWRAVAQATDLDAVIVATPPALHAEMATAAVASGLAVLVAKPLTTNLDEALALRNLVLDRGGLMWVDHTHLFHPAWRGLKRAAAGLGPLRAIRAEARNLGPYRRDVPVLWDWGAHDVAMCLDLVGCSPDDVRAIEVERRSVEDGVGQSIRLGLTFPGSVTADIFLSNLIAKQRRFEAIYENAALVYDDLAPAKLSRHDVVRGEIEGPGEPLPVAKDLPLTVAVSEFAAAVTRRSKDLASLDLGVETVRVLGRCEAGMTGAP
jgi:predicted dehydrogenase